MFENLEIRNFRLFEHLKIEKLGRVNLLAGMNNSGKTSVFEALFLLCGIGNPELVLRVNAFRGFGELVTPVAVRETLLKPLFYHFNSNQSIEINSQSKLHKTMKLIIKVERKNTVALPLQGTSLDNSPKELVEIPPSMFVTSQESVWSDSLHLLYSSDSDKVINEGYIHMANDGMQVIAPSSHNPFLAMFLSTRGYNPREDATRLGDLRRRKQGSFLVNALKIMEPRLQAIEENSVAGYPMIWGDIGLSELVPLSIMGEGMTRMARIILAISSAVGGIVMVDEIENGIHYSVLEKVWSAIADAAERAQVQVFATTHSFECMEAAHRALGEKLMFHRIEEDREGKKRCVTLEAEGLAAAIHHGFEVR
ncbi:MAG: AAA family ATPase [Cyanobacteria bacterium MAG CAR3_bin_5]|nr:AAA family ATPase [Cyanobacteria bacterium MAG CAR3_bin_5]MCY4236130.1 AAA family ATPase [Cyanobacteria bacterium MAG CAR2_bin_4]